MSVFYCLLSSEVIIQDLYSVLANKLIVYINYKRTCCFRTNTVIVFCIHNCLKSKLVGIRLVNKYDPRLYLLGFNPTLTRNDMWIGFLVPTLYKWCLEFKHISKHHANIMYYGFMTSDKDIDKIGRPPIQG